MTSQKERQNLNDNKDWKPTAYLRLIRVGGGWVIQQEFVSTGKKAKTKRWVNIPKEEFTR